MSGEHTGLWAVGGTVAVLLLLTVWVLWRKGRPFARGHLFRASRLSTGNRLFPTQVLITTTSVVQYTPQWIGRQEKSIHLAHVSSVKIDTHLFFSDVRIETSGGADPILCYGHHKRDAVEIKTRIEQFQTDYYRGDGRPERSPSAVNASGARVGP